MNQSFYLTAHQTLRNRDTNDSRLLDHSDERKETRVSLLRPYISLLTTTTIKMMMTMVSVARAVSIMIVMRVIRVLKKKFHRSMPHRYPRIQIEACKKEVVEVK